MSTLSRAVKNFYISTSLICGYNCFFLRIGFGIGLIPLALIIILCSSFFIIRNFAMSEKGMMKLIITMQSFMFVFLIIVLVWSIYTMFMDHIEGILMLLLIVPDTTLLVFLSIFIVRNIKILMTSSHQ